MLDPKFVRDNLAAVAVAAKNKNIDFNADKFLEISDKRLKAIANTEELRRIRNEGSEAVKKAKSKEEREPLLEKMRIVSQELTSIEEELRNIETEFDAIMLTVPSIPSADTPIGLTDADNVEVKRVGKVPAFDFKIKDHMELGTSLGIIDFQKASTVAGSRSYFLMGAGAEIERAIFSLTLDLLKERGYKQMSIPVMVKTSAMTGTGYLPAGRDQAYYIERDDLWLVGTAEVSLVSYLSGETINAEDLPVKLCAHSSCFRREAGAHGKDTKGLYRGHQFQKIEQVIVCEPTIEASDKLHDELLNNAETILQMLELPYRVVQVCTGDMGQGQVRKHDIETWMPSRNSYGETHSCSSFYDFQARRSKIKIKDKSGKSQFAYTLNNTAIATPRILIPLLENHQTADGKIKIPNALRKYMGNMEYIG